ncbi:hypothetical protein EDC04DRAFT_2552478, partial [Pisolithus marmoratus]
GEKVTLQQIRGLAKADPKYQVMTQDEKDELLCTLTKYRALKNMSVHATNSAAACDAQTTLEHIFKILDGLALHTRIYVCLFATCGHVYDLSQPFWYRTNNVMDFWEDVMDLEPDEIVHKLEQWVCEKHGIDLLGWLDGVPFQSPHAIINAEHLWSLRDALKAGTCHWAYMSRQKCLEYHDQLK